MNLLIAKLEAREHQGRNEVEHRIEIESEFLGKFGSHKEDHL